MKINMVFQKLMLFTFLITATTGSALYGPCERNDHCGTLDTFCKNHTCMCKDDFAVFYDHCVQLANPLIPCTHKSNCKVALGQKGICPNKQCACKSFHHLHKSQCVKSKGLDEECDYDHQCYCGQDCADKIHCMNRMCTCRPGFRKYSRRCIPDVRVFSSQTSINFSDACFSTSHYVFVFLILLFVQIV